MGTCILRCSTNNSCRGFYERDRIRRRGYNLMNRRHRTPSPESLDAMIAAQSHGELRQKDHETLIAERRKGHLSDVRVNDAIKQRNKSKSKLTAKQVDDFVFQRYRIGKAPDDFVLQSYGVLSLYRNDLDEILQLFRSVAKDITIVLDDYRIDTTADIVRIRERKTNYLSIVSRTPDIALELRDNSAILSLGCANTPDQLLFATKLHDLLLSKQGLHLPYFFAILAVPFIIFDQVLPRVRETLSTHTYNSLALICLLTVVYAALSEHRWRYAHVKIYLYDAPNNWLERHKETVLVGVLTAFGSFIAVTVVPQLITWLTNLPK